MLSNPLKLTIPTLLLLISCGDPQAHSQFLTWEESQQQALEDAMWDVEDSLSEIDREGYRQWTPTTAAEEVTGMMNETGMMPLDEQQEYRETDIIPRAIPYLYDQQPRQPWSIVVVPDEAGQAVIVEAYGYDLAEPVFVGKVDCCSSGSDVGYSRF